MEKQAGREQDGQALKKGKEKALEKIAGKLRRHEGRHKDNLAQDKGKRTN